KNVTIYRLSRQTRKPSKRDLRKAGWSSSRVPKVVAKRESRKKQKEKVGTDGRSCAPAQNREMHLRLCSSPLLGIADRAVLLQMTAPCHASVRVNCHNC